MRVLAGSLGLVALASVAVGWLQNPDRITAAEALAAAEGAFDAAGIDDAVVDPHPVAGSYAAPGDDERIPVWKTSAAIDDGTVELWLSRSDGEAVFLDDRTPDGAAQILTDAQFRRLADHRDNPAVGRQIRRNLLLTLAAGLVMLVALRHMVAAGRRPAAAARNPAPHGGRPLRAGPPEPVRSAPLRRPRDR